METTNTNNTTEQATYITSGEQGWTKEDFHTDHIKPDELQVNFVGSEEAKSMHKLVKDFPRLVRVLLMQDIKEDEQGRKYFEPFRMFGFRFTTKEIDIYDNKYNYVVGAQPIEYV